MKIKKITYFFPLIAQILSSLFADTGYNTIYLMEFENIRNDFTNLHLKSALPDLIKENYKFRKDIKVEYAGDIKPYISKYNRIEQDSIKGLIISGSFQTVNDKFFVEFEAYDIHNWKQLAKRQVSCPVNDIICVHDAFLISIEKSISPFLADKLDINETISKLKKEQRIKKIPSGNLEHNQDYRLDSGQLDDLSLKDDLEKPYSRQSRYGDRHYREFNLNKLHPQKSPQKKINTANLIQVLEQIVMDPYDIIIGDLSIELDSKKSDMILAEIPISYSIRNEMIIKALGTLPFEKYIIDNENMILEFSSENYIFDELLMEKLSLMQFQVMPVIFFNNRIGQPQLIILDSWHEKTQLFNPREIDVLWEKQFTPLYALTPSPNQMQMSLDTRMIDANYSFTIPYEKIGDYTKVTVKFMKESELRDLIGNSVRGR